MIVSRVKLRNWKNFHECDVTIDSRCFIVGANAAGKSNFLDVLRFLHDLAKDGGGLQTAVSSRGGVTKIRSLSARKLTDIMIEVDLKEFGEEKPLWRYSLDIKNVGGGIQKNKASIISEKVYDYVQEDYILNRNNKSDGEDSETLQYTHLEQVTKNASFRDIRDAFRSIEYLNVIPQLVRESNSVALTIGKEDYYGRNFLKRLSNLPTKTRDSYLRKINEVMVDVVPQLTELSFVKDQEGIPHLEARYQHWRAKGAIQNESMFSDGTLRMIGFLFAMLDGSGTLLLEEPEINLHSSVVEQLPEYIAGMQRQRNRQVIVTTHSYDILSNEGIRGSEVLFLENTNEGTELTNVSEREDLMAILNAGLTVADALIKRCAPQNADKISYKE